MRNGSQTWMPLGSMDRFKETVQRFRESLLLYAAACLIIRDKEARFHHLEFNTAQKIVDKKLNTQFETTGRVRAIILKARQEGISTYVAARFFRAIHLYPGTVALVVADLLERAEKIFQMYNRFFENLPEELKPTPKSSLRGRYMAFKHDSELSVRPASDAEAGRAQTLHRVHASELAFWGNTARDTWVSLLNAVPRLGSEVIVESTAKGAGGLFHELWEEAENSSTGEWLAIFLPWWVHEEYEMPCPEDVKKAIDEYPDDFERIAREEGIPYEGEQHILSYEKLAWRRAIITEVFGGDPLRPSKDAIRQFQQEYPATAEEAFLASGACYFDEESLRILSHKTSEPAARGMLKLKKEESKQIVTIEPNIRGSVRIWEAPAVGKHYVIGADTAEGKLVIERRISDVSIVDANARDYSTAQVLRLAYKDKGGVHHPPKIVAEIHGPLAPDIFADQLQLLGRLFSCGDADKGERRSKALVGVERSHSSGQTVLQLLRDHWHYNPLYWHRSINVRHETVGRRLGWITDGVSRMPMLDTLSELIRNLGIEVPSKDMVRELLTFVVWPNGKPAAEEGTHDDRVMAFGIAVAMMGEHRHGKTSKVPSYRPRF